LIVVSVKEKGRGMGPQYEGLIRKEMTLREGGGAFAKSGAFVLWREGGSFVRGQKKESMRIYCFRGEETGGQGYPGDQLLMKKKGFPAFDGEMRRASQTPVGQGTASWHRLFCGRESGRSKRTRAKVFILAGRSEHGAAGPSLRKKKIEDSDDLHGHEERKRGKRSGGEKKGREGA